MTASQPKKLSRRDAIKILGAAAGASVLANLPTKWSKPQLTQGVLPAHAQTSSLGLTMLKCEFTLDINTGLWSSTPFVGPLPLPKAVEVDFTLTLVDAHFNSASTSPLTDSGTADETSGTTTHVSNLLYGNIVPNTPIGSATIVWSFPSPLIGTGTCSQTVSWP